MRCFKCGTALPQGAAYGKKLNEAKIKREEFQDRNFMIATQY